MPTILHEVSEIENEDMDHPDFGAVNPVHRAERMASDARTEGSNSGDLAGWGTI